MLTRRQLLKLAALAGSGLVVPTHWLTDNTVARAFYQTSGLSKFSQPLRGVGPLGIPVAAPDRKKAPVTGVTHYTIDINQYTDQLHPDLGPTTLRGYHPAVPLGGGVQPQKHLGGIIVAQKGTPIQITFRNNLPTSLNQYPLPIDATLMDVDLQHPDRVSVHLHGGFVPWVSDGGPYTYFDHAGYGPSTPTTAGNALTLLNPALPVGQAEYFYPNTQSARMLWYHDHAVGYTRLNAYAGLATAYILRDAFESNLRNIGLPDFVENGGREIPLVIQDKVFVNASTIDSIDPTWPGPKTTGSLWYPHVYEPDRWELNQDDPPPPPTSDPSVVPEMFGDTMLANGTAYPVAAIQARRYRLRILNACQARFLNLQLYVDDGSPDGITLDGAYRPTNAKGPDFFVLGTEGGFLSKPAIVPSNVPFSADTMSGSLITAPAERWDVVVDFSPFAGKRIILYNDAPAPFPMGDSLYDYFPGAPDNPTVTTPGSGPNTRQIMCFDVGRLNGKDSPLRITTNTDMTSGLDPFLVPPTTEPLPPPPGIPIWPLTLNEGFDEFGRLIQLLGINTMGGNGYARAYLDPATETPAAGSTEVWEIANLTGDTHPIHFHLVNVQVLSRQPFNVEAYDGTPAYTGPARGPDPVELGWKETVKMHPGEVTRVIMKFSLPAVPFTVPSSPRTGGAEYVWHCHILEHEEHDMMRPLVVL